MADESTALARLAAARSLHVVTTPVAAQIVRGQDQARQELADRARDEAAVRAAVTLGAILRAALDGDAGAVLEESARLPVDEVAELHLAAETLAETLADAMRGRRT